MRRRTRRKPTDLNDTYRVLPINVSLRANHKTEKRKLRYAALLLLGKDEVFQASEPTRTDLDSIESLLSILQCKVRISSVVVALVIDSARN